MKIHMNSKWSKSLFVGVGATLLSIIGFAIVSVANVPLGANLNSAVFVPDVIGLAILALAYDFWKGHGTRYWLDAAFIGIIGAVVLTSFASSLGLSSLTSGASLGTLAPIYAIVLVAIGSYLGIEIGDYVGKAI